MLEVVWKSILSNNKIIATRKLKILKFPKFCRFGLVNQFPLSTSSEQEDKGDYLIDPMESFTVIFEEG